MEKAYILCLWAAVNFLTYRRVTSGNYGNISPEIRKKGLLITLIITTTIAISQLFGASLALKVAYVFLLLPLLLTIGYIAYLYRYKPHLYRQLITSGNTKQVIKDVLTQTTMAIKQPVRKPDIKNPLLKTKLLLIAGLLIFLAVLLQTGGN